MSQTAEQTQRRPGEPLDPATRERLRQLATQTVDPGEEIGRARAKARGEDYDPEKHHPELSRPTRRMDPPPAYESDLQDLVGRFMGRARSLPRDLPREAPTIQMSAAQVRLKWYIPERHRNDSLETFRPVTQTQKIALEATRDWIDQVKNGRGSALALIGEVGTGKSHLLHAAVREVNLAGIHAAAAGWYDLADLFRRAKFGSDGDVTEARQQRDRILAARAIAIDEIRPTSGTGYDTTELSQLMTRAYRECQGVLVTSNYADEELSDIVSLAASSRLTQVVITGPDMRRPENRSRYLNG